MLSTDFKDFQGPTTVLHIHKILQDFPGPSYPVVFGNAELTVNLIKATKGKVKSNGMNGPDEATSITIQCSFMMLAHCRVNLISFVVILLRVAGTQLYIQVKRVMVE